MTTKKKIPIAIPTLLIVVLAASGSLRHVCRNHHSQTRQAPLGRCDGSQQDRGAGQGQDPQGGHGQGCGQRHCQHRLERRTPRVQRGPQRRKRGPLPESHRRLSESIAVEQGDESVFEGRSRVRHRPGDGEDGAADPARIDEAIKKLEDFRVKQADHYRFYDALNFSASFTPPGTISPRPNWHTMRSARLPGRITR